MNLDNIQNFCETLDIVCWEWLIEGNSANEVIVNDAWRKMFSRYNENSSLTMEAWENAVYPDDKKLFISSRDACLADKTLNWDVDVRLRHGDGEWRWFNIRGKVVNSHEPPEKKMTGVLVDVNQRKSREQVFLEGKTRYTQLSKDMSSVMIYQVVIGPDDSRVFTYVSENIIAVNEITAESVMSDSNVLYSQVMPEYIDALIENEKIAIEGMTTFSMEVPLRLPSGKIKWFQLVSNPCGLPDGSVIWDGIEFDVTKRKLAEAEVERAMNAERETLEMLQLVMDTIPQFIFWKDKESVYLGCNENFARVAGVGCAAEIAGKTDYDLPWKKEEADFFREVDRRVMDNNAPEMHIIEPQYQSGGKQSWLDTSKMPLHDAEGNVVGMIGTYEDITEKKRINELLIQSEKMMSVGGLAAGMAHEINNPLAGILLNVQLLKKKLMINDQLNRKVADDCGISLEALQKYIMDSKVGRSVDSIDEAGKRAAEIVKEMLSFARKGDDEKVPSSISGLMDKSIALLHQDFHLTNQDNKGRIEIKTDYGDQIPEVLCSPSKIQQVFLNILKNGYEAMSEKEYKNGVPCFKISVSKDESWVRVEIEDNGPGMDEATRKRVFEPFFTTKGVGRGTGLGMSVSYFIVTENHNGKMEIETQKNNWTRFIISLPITI